MESWKGCPNGYQEAKAGEASDQLITRLEAIFPGLGAARSASGKWPTPQHRRVLARHSGQYGPIRHAPARLLPMPFNRTGIPNLYSVRRFLLPAGLNAVASALRCGTAVGADSGLNPWPTRVIAPDTTNRAKRDLCKHCAFGKNKKKKFVSPQWLAVVPPPKSLLRSPGATRVHQQALAAAASSGSASSGRERSDRDGRRRIPTSHQTPSKDLMRISYFWKGREAETHLELGVRSISRAVWLRQRLLAFFSCFAPARLPIAPLNRLTLITLYLAWCCPCTPWPPAAIGQAWLLAALPLGLALFWAL